MIQMNWFVGSIYEKSRQNSHMLSRVDSVGNFTKWMFWMHVICDRVYIAVSKTWGGAK